MGKCCTHLQKLYNYYYYYYYYYYYFANVYNICHFLYVYNVSLHSKNGLLPISLKNVAKCSCSKTI